MGLGPIPSGSCYVANIRVSPVRRLPRTNPSAIGPKGSSRHVKGPLCPKRLTHEGAQYSRWQTTYRVLKRQRSRTSDIWYARQIATQATGARYYVSTIRRHMTRGPGTSNPRGLRDRHCGEGLTVVEQVERTSSPGKTCRISTVELFVYRPTE